MQSVAGPLFVRPHNLLRPFREARYVKERGVIAGAEPEDYCGDAECR